MIFLQLCVAQHEKGGNTGVKNAKQYNNFIPSLFLAFLSYMTIIFSSDFNQYYCSTRRNWPPRSLGRR